MFGPVVACLHASVTFLQGTRRENTGKIAPHGLKVPRQNH